MTPFIATGPNYEALIIGAMSADDAKRIAAEDSGLMPWCIAIRQAENGQ